MSMLLAILSTQTGPRYIGTTSLREGDQSVTFAPPSGVQVGDQLVAFGFSAIAGSSWSASGWTITYGSDPWSPRLAVFRRTHDGSSNYTFSQNTYARVGVSISAFRGGNASVVGTKASAANPVIAPSVNVPSYPSSILLVAGGNINSPTATPSGFVEIHANVPGSGEPRWRVYLREFAAAGATGTVSVDMTGATNLSAVQVVVEAA